MKKTKFNPQLLQEELNRFKLINEYSFYKEANSDKPIEDLLLGNVPLGEADEDPNDAASNIENDLDLPPDGGDPNAIPPSDPNAAPAPEGGDNLPPTQAEPTLVPPASEPAPVEEPAGDEVEIDVTELVDASEGAEDAAQRASRTSMMLLKKLEDLEARIASMDNVSHKIDAIEKEIIKRNPTNVEKLEMQTVHSGPYTQKLTDYWADKQGAYDVMGNDKAIEYTLTQDDIDSSYSDGNVKKSFTVKDSDFEEEDI